MAALIIIGIVMAVTGVMFGAYLKICFAIRKEDRARSLPFDAPNSAAQTARSVVGINGSRWD